MRVEEINLLKQFSRRQFIRRVVKIRPGVGKNTVIQVLSDIVAFGGYFKFERVLSL